MSLFITEHYCNIKKNTIPKLAPSASRRQKISRLVKSIMMISAKNRQTSTYFISSTKIKEEIERHLACKHFVIHPLSIFIQYWQFLMSFVWYLNITFGLSAPLLQVFIKYSDNIYRPVILTYEITNHICILHIFVNFFTGYINQKTKQCILDRKKIIVRYITTYFLVDILVLDFILELSLRLPKLNLPHHVVLGFWKLARVLRLYTAGTYLEYLTQYCKFNPSFYKTIQIIIKWFFLLHINAMAFISVSACNIRGRTWTTRLCKIYNTEQKFKPINCTYISAETINYYIKHSYRETLTRICLIYWGQLTPLTWEDLSVSIISMFSGFCFNLYFIVFLKNSMEDAYKASIRYEEQTVGIKTFCRKYFLPEELENKILWNLEEKFEGEYYDYKKFNKFTSRNLKADLFYEHPRNYKILEKSNIFNGVSPAGIVAIIKSLQRAIYFPGDCIVPIGSRTQTMYIIAIGSVAIYDSMGKELYHLGEGEHFGIHSIYAKKVMWRYAAVAIEVCEIYRISRKAYEDRIVKYDWTFLQRMISSIPQERRNTVEDTEVLI